MKTPFLLPSLGAAFLFSACEAVVVDRPGHRSTHVERDVRHHDSRRHHDDDDGRPSIRLKYEDQDNRHPQDYRGERQDRDDRRRGNTGLMKPRQSTSSNVAVRYYSDSQGRYYFKDGRRIYTNAGVH